MSVAQELLQLEKIYKISVLLMSDIIDSYRTVYPIPLGFTTSWNSTLIEETYRGASEAKDCLARSLDSQELMGLWAVQGLMEQVTILKEVFEKKVGAAKITY